jgi:protein-tyrosine phosphatase
MEIEVYWVPGPWPGRLGIVPRPRGGDWLADEIRAWREAGIDVVTSLLAPEENDELDLGQEAAYARAEGLQFLSLPIPDYGVPRDNERFAQIVRQLGDALAVDRNVAVHCRQGIGRSSVLVAALLVVAGVEPDEALRRIQKARGRPVPDTREQREWVAQQTASLRAEHRQVQTGSAAPSPFDLARGELTVPDDFNDPLPEDIHPEAGRTQEVR